VTLLRLLLLFVLQLALVALWAALRVTELVTGTLARWLDSIIKTHIKL